MNPKELELSELRSHIGYKLRVVSNAVSHSFARKLLSSGVTVAEWVILREMYSGAEKTSPSTLAEFTGLTRGAVSKLIDRLIKKELVISKASGDDRRYLEISITQKATELIPALSSIADENDESFFSMLTEFERSNLTSILMKLAKAHKLNITPIR